MGNGIYVYIDKENNAAYIDICPHKEECRNLYYENMTLSSLSATILNLQELYELEVFTYYSPKDNDD